MPELYFYTTPPSSVVTLTLDSGVMVTGIPGSYNGRNDGHVLNMPTGTPRQGSTLRISCDGYQAIEYRGIYAPGSEVNAPSNFLLDDVRLTEQAAPPDVVPEPEPPPVDNTDPMSIIEAVYATGDYELVSKEGCGRFTEACCSELHNKNHQTWGHIKKNPGQNQFNGHAVDAVQCLAGEYTGIWDIILDSESANASPAFNHKGPADPVLWYYPAAPLTDGENARTPRRPPKHGRR